MGKKRLVQITKHSVKCHADSLNWVSWDPFCSKFLSNWKSKWQFSLEIFLKEVFTSLKNINVIRGTLEGTLTSNWSQIIIQENTHMLYSLKPHVYFAAISSRRGTRDVKDAEEMLMFPDQACSWARQMCSETPFCQESYNWHWFVLKNSQAARTDCPHMNSTMSVEENIPLVLLVVSSSCRLLSNFPVSIFRLEKHQNCAQPVPLKNSEEPVENT